MTLILEVGVIISLFGEYKIEVISRGKPSMFFPTETPKNKLSLVMDLLCLMKIPRGIFAKYPKQTIVFKIGF